MRIKILRSTRIPGKTLLQGEFHDVSNEHAIELIEMGKAIVEEEVDVSVDTETSKYSELKVPELKEKALELGIELQGTEKKAEIIELIEAFEEIEE